MHNRGNGKGGGIAAVGLSPQTWASPRMSWIPIICSRWLCSIPKSARQVEKEFIEPYLEVHKAGRIPTVDDYRDIKGLDVRPPDVMRYFVRVKTNVLDRFIEENNLQDLDPRHAEDEFIYQNSYPSEPEILCLAG